MGNPKAGVTEAAARILATLGIAFPLLRLITFLDIGQVSFATYALLCPLPLHLQLIWGSKRWRESGEIALLASLFAFIYFHGATFHPGYNAWAVAACCTGMASLLVNGAHMLWAHDRDRLPYFLPSIWVLLGTLVVPIALFLLTSDQPRPAYDAWLYEFDARLGLQASFVVGRWFLNFPPLATVCSLIYLGSPTLVVILYGAQLHYKRLRNGDLIFTCIAAGVAGGLLLKIVPAAGPLYAFHTSFPYQAPDIVPGFLHTVLLKDPLNCIPSLHSAWAFLMFWGSRKCGPWVRSFAFLILIGTLLATLGFGEHYLVDLVVGLSLAAAVDVACLRGWSRKGWARPAISIALTTAITIVWLVLLREQSLLNLSRLTAWSLVAGSVLISLFLRYIAVAELEQGGEETRLELAIPPYRAIISTK